MPNREFILFSTVCLIFCLVCSNCIEINDILPCENNGTFDDEPAPPFPQAFSAKYEIVTSPNSSRRIFVTLNYDAPNNRVSIIKNMQGLDQTMILDYNKRHSVVFSPELGSSSACSVNPIENTDEFRYDLENLFPFLELNLSSSKIFSPEGLFGVNIDKIRGYIKYDVIREKIPCRVWLYCYGENKTLGLFNVFVYWSDMQWEISGAAKPTVLGYESKIFDPVSKTPITSTSVSVVYMSDDIDLTTFQIPEGIQCASVESTSRPLPIKKPTDGVVYFQTEVLFQDRRKILEVETQIDLINDFGKIRYQSNGVTVTNIADTTKKVVYVQRGTDRGTNCTEQTLKTGLFGELSADEIPIIHLANLGDLFDDHTRLKWMYIGQRMNRNMLTDVWQRQRSDWPYPDMYFATTLWDWHFINKTTNDGNVVAIPVHLQIKILMGDIPYLSRGTVIKYSFRGYRTDDSIGISGHNAFDIGQCFSDIGGQKQHLQFQIKVIDKNHLNDAGVFDSYTFLWSWQVVIAAAADIFLLKVTQVKSVITDDKLFIQFYLLGDPSNNATDVTEITNAKENLINFLNGGTLLAQADGKTYTAIPNSLIDVAKRCPEKTLKKRLRRSTEAQINHDELNLFPPENVVGVCVGSFLSGIAIGSGLLLFVAVQKKLFCFS